MGAVDTAPREKAPPRERRRSPLAGLVRFGLPLLLLAEIVVWSLALPDSFPTETTLTSILSSQATAGMIALAVMVPLIANEFDLSVGSVAGLAAIIAVYLVGESGAAPAVAILAAVAMGALVGAANAAFVVWVRLHSFIATLGMGTVISAAALYITDGEVLFKGLGSGFKDLGQLSFGPIPIAFAYLLVLALVLWFVLEHTPAGRYLTAVGFGRPAARLAGVRVKTMVAASLIASGAIAGFAGAIEGARLASASPTGGNGFMLPAFAAAFLGATTIRRGQFNTWGTVVGVFFLAVGISGLQQAGAPFWVSPLFNGLALLIAVSLTSLAARRGSSG